MIAYQTKIKKFSGSNYKEIMMDAKTLFKWIKKRTKRRPYIRSAYFDKQKIFFDYFWQHLFKKSFKIRTQRLKFLPCAIDLIQNSKIPPTSKENVDNRNEILHRFKGETRDKEVFYVQIKEDKKTGRKYFMSCFSGKK